LAQAGIDTEHRPPGEPAGCRGSGRILPGVAVDEIGDAFDRGAVERAHVSVDHGRRLTAVLPEFAELLLKFFRLPPVAQLARLRRQRILRWMVEEHGDAG